MSDMPPWVTYGAAVLTTLGVVQIIRQAIAYFPGRYTAMEQQLAAGAEECRKTNADLQGQINAIRAEQVKDGVAAQLRLERSIDRNTEVMERSIAVTERTNLVLERFSQKVADATPIMGNQVIPQYTIQPRT